MIDGWDEVNRGYPWNKEDGPGPWSSDLWKGVSKKYAQGAVGDVNVIQTPNKPWDPATVWHTQEKPALLDLQELGQIGDINLHVVDGSSATQQLPKGYIDQLLEFDQRP